MAAPEAGLRAWIDSMPVLTPGDFAAVARRGRLRPIASAAALIEALAEECALKEGPKRSIGFL